MKTCTVKDCMRDQVAKSFCSMHYKRARKHGDPSVVMPPNGGIRVKGPGHPMWRGRDITYVTAHTRIRSHRGAAKCHVCECGDRAQEWAYDYSDPSPLTGVSRGCEVLFSPDVDRYKPMCGPCHRKFDQNRRAWCLA